MKLTVETLTKAKACTSQVKLFMGLFPEGAEVSEDIAISVANKFNWDWAAVNLLSPEGCEAYVEATALLWKAYEEATALFWKDYKEATALFWKDYKEAEALLWKIYKEAKARTFAKLYKQENP